MLGFLFKISGAEGKNRAVSLGCRSAGDIPAMIRAGCWPLAHAEDNQGGQAFRGRFLGFTLSPGHSGGYDLGHYQM